MKCKFCGKEIDDGSAFCGYCGKKQPQIRCCVKCGHEIGLDDKWCGYCGTEQPSQDGADSSSIKESEAEPETQQEKGTVSSVVNDAKSDKKQSKSTDGREKPRRQDKPKASKWKYFITVIGILTILLIILGGLCYFKFSLHSQEDGDEDEDCAEVVHVNNSNTVRMYDMDFSTNTIEEIDAYLEKGVYPIEERLGDTLRVGVEQGAVYIVNRDLSIEKWKATDGHGYVVPGEKSAMVIESPSYDGEYLTDLEGCSPGDIPEGYECLGVVDSWYKIRLENGKVGYVRKDEVSWSICHPDCAGCIR